MYFRLSESNKDWPVLTSTRAPAENTRIYYIEIKMK